jgi:NADPH:quinone reductase-like Zn-dependent oxidoreductase
MDFVFDGAGGENIRKSFAILRRGGMLIEYGFSFKSFRYFIKSVFDLFSGIPKGIKVKGYGISANYKLNKKSVLEDIVTLINLLEAGKIKPVIYDRFPILEAARANMLLESGQVTGNVVLYG